MELARLPMLLRNSLLISACVEVYFVSAHLGVKWGKENEITVREC